MGIRFGFPGSRIFSPCPDILNLFFCSEIYNMPPEFSIFVSIFLTNFPPRIYRINPKFPRTVPNFQFLSRFFNLYFFKSYSMRLKFPETVLKFQSLSRFFNLFFVLNFELARRPEFSVLVFIYLTNSPLPRICDMLSKFRGTVSNC